MTKKPNLKLPPSGVSVFRSYLRVHQLMYVR